MIKELMHDSVFLAGFEKMYVADGGKRLLP